MAHDVPQRLLDLQRAFDQVRLDDARQLLLELSGEERGILQAHLGESTVDQLTRSAARGVRRAKVGRVAVINGIMGALLDRRYKNTTTKRIWIDYLRLFNGALADLRMGLDGGSADPEIEIFVGGMHKSYWRLLLELDTAWHVLPCPFDWRLDIDRSAEVLAQQLQHWAHGEPVHIVAHSMGGLVARRMIQRFPDLWTALDDPDGHRRGGRLVMLGTPNQGSFAITLTLTGEEKAVRRLALLDRKHGLKATQGTISTFHGPYQMLPSPAVDLGDDHGDLFHSSAWGTVPHHPDLLELGRRFQQEMAQVDGHGRLIYVAGYDYETPVRIRIDGPGVFSYQTTLDGDGRVPHALGLLDGVPTYWVREIHGKLPESDLVLADIHELLTTGQPRVLLRDRPTRRALREEPRWRSGEELEVELLDLDPFFEPPPAEPRGAEAETGTKRRGRAEKKTVAETEKERSAAGSLSTAELQATAEALITGSWVGDPLPPAARRGFGDGAGRSAAKKASAPKVKLRVEVVWGDIRRVRGDVYCVGHYQGVLPQNAEGALDEVVSGLWPKPRGKQEEGSVRESRVLKALTENGILDGQLGDVHFFPWAGSSIEAWRRLDTAGTQDRPEDAKRHADPSYSPPAPMVAVAGMGYPGTFNAARLRRLARNLSWAIGLMPGVCEVCTVLIGSGDGGLTVSDALRELLLGMADSLGAGLDKVDVNVSTLKVVELNLDRAHEIYDALERLPDMPGIELVRARDFDGDLGGRVTDEHCLSMVLSAAARIQKLGEGKDAARRKARSELEKLLAENLPYGKRHSQEVTAALLGQVAAEDVESAESWEKLAQRLRVGRKSEASRTIATRISFVRDDGAFRIAAIQSSAVVPERRLSLDKSLVDEVIRRLIDPSEAALREYAPSLRERLIPRDFRSKVDFEQTLIFEVDRSTAAIPFEMLPLEKNGSEEVYLALRGSVARQLRTTYSPPPMARPPLRWRALVIGDPGDPAKGLDLPGAREEARKAVDLLLGKGFSVDARIGVPVGVGDLGDEPGVRPATRLEILNLLERNEYDLLHYCGHGDFDPEDPRRAGWVFKDGLLTAAELENLDAVPQLIVANACLSSRLSQRIYGGGGPRGDDGLLPTLADEFFRRGVWNYLGTAWEVSDAGAILFMETFYEQLLPARSSEPQQARARGLALGKALLAARTRLWQERGRFGALWAAYQHYGDPELVLESL